VALLGGLEFTVTALAAVPIAAIWLVTGLWLGRRQGVLEAFCGRGHRK
jgi:hypothetical protein